MRRSRPTKQKTCSSPSIRGRAWVRRRSPRWAWPSLSARSRFRPALPAHLPRGLRSARPAWPRNVPSAPRFPVTRFISASLAFAVTAHLQARLARLAYDAGLLQLVPQIWDSVTLAELVDPGQAGTAVHPGQAEATVTSGCCWVQCWIARGKWTGDVNYPTM